MDRIPMAESIGIGWRNESESGGGLSRNTHFGRHPSRVFGVILALVVVTGFACYVYLFSVCPKETPFRDYHTINLAGLFLAFLLLQALRALLEQLDIRAREHKFNFTTTSFIKNAGDLFMNITLFFAIYTMVVYASASKESYWCYALPGYVVSALSVVRILKFRIYDDLFRRWLDRGGSFIGPTTSVPTTLLQGVYNVLFRAYFIIALSFACIYLLIHFGNSLTPDGKGPFAVTNPSGNLLVDFIYFSVITMSTVGYGDILPVAALPKLICVFQVLLGYFFIGSTFAYVFFVISARPNDLGGKTGGKT